MPNRRSWFKRFRFSSKGRDPEPMASGALRPWHPDQTTRDTFRDEILHQHSERQGATETAGELRRVRSTAFPVPSGGGLGPYSMTRQPSPTNSFWLPVPTDPFWKPAQPSGPSPLEQHSLLTTGNYQASEIYTPSTDIVHLVDKGTQPPRGISAIPKSSLPTQHASLQHTVSPFSIDFHAPEEDIYSATPPPTRPLYPVGGRQPPQLAYLVPGGFPVDDDHSVPREQSPSGWGEFVFPFTPQPEPKDCVICADTKPLNRFPVICPSRDCDHLPEACLDCVQEHIRATINDKVWHAKVVTCPQCNKPMEYEEVREHADPATFEKYDSRVLSDATAQTNGYFSCPGDGCSSGQIHEAGDRAPIVTCIGCQRRFCFRHGVQWHETMSCEEYEQLLQDPDNFKSAFELENEKVERQREVEERKRKEMEDADRRFAQALIEDEERRREYEEQAERERAARREVERKEAERRAASERTAKEARARTAREARRRAEENRASEAKVSETTKNCPGRGCGRPIEKNDGCAHMTCSVCKHNFCYDCLADYSAILKTDNSAHKATCQWHPDHLQA